MLRGMARLTTKADILRPVITLLVCGLLWGLVAEFVQSAAGKSLWPAILGGVFLLVAFSTVRSLYVRTRKLLGGRCPHPPCHGVVQHSERVPRGYLVCPTCKHRWPELQGMRFLLSGREHP